MSRYPNFTPPTLGTDFTTEEVTFLENLVGLSYVAGDILYYNGTVLTRLPIGSANQHLIVSGGIPAWSTDSAAGTVTSVSVTTANGVSGSVATATTTPAITLTLGAITPTTVNGLTISTSTGTLTITNGKTLSVSNTLTLTATDGSTLAIGTGGTLGTAAYTASTAYATTALGNLASVAINTTLVSDTDNTDSLGTTAIAWSDLFLGSGAVITFNSAPSTADITITHSADTLTFAGGTIVLGTATATGGLTGNVTGNVSGSAATVTTAAQPAITSLGTLTTLTVDDITINGNTISSAGSSTLAITPTAGQAITFDATVTLDAGVIAGATSITSTAMVINGATGLTLGTSSSLVGGMVLKNATNTNTVTINSGVTSASYTLTLPTAVAAVTGYVLTSTDAGVLSWAAGGAGAATSLNNLASVAINTTLVSDTYNTDALGTSAIAWSDLFLGTGAVIEWSSAASTPDVTLTHSANTLTFDGGTIVLGTATATGGLTGNVTGTATNLSTTARARAYKSGAQNISTAAIVQLDAETYDSGSNFNTSTYRFTAPVTGYYIISAGIQIASVADGKVMNIIIRKNGSDIFSSGIITGAAGGGKAAVSDIVLLTATDYIELWSQTDDSDRAIVATSVATYLSVHLLST